MKVLYISYFFPPFYSIGGSRALGQVNSLKGFGYDVKVISSNRQSLNRDSSDINLNREEIIFFESEIKANSTKILNYKSTVTSIKKALMKIPKCILRCIFLINYIIFGISEKKNWVKEVLKNIDIELDDWHPDIIFSSCSPIDSHIIASKLQKKFDCQWVAEYRDSYSFNTMGFSENEDEILSRYLRNKEKNILKNCSLIIGATAHISNYYLKHFKIESMPIYGGWDGALEDFAISHNDISSNTNIRIIHAGSMLYGSRNLDIIFEMYNLFERENFGAKFYFFGRHTELFKKEVHKYSLKDSIFLNEEISKSAIEKEYLKSDVLLIIMKNDPMEQYTVTGKLFEYIKYRKPIIIIDKFQSEASEIIQSNNFGFVATNGKELKDIIQTKLQNYKPPTKDIILNFSRQSQISKLFDHIEKFKKLN